MQPFRAFFFLAALDAIAGVAMWLLTAVGVVSRSWAGAPIEIWHREELLFGMVPAGLAGFLLTALPRWTDRQPISPFQVRALVVLWLAGRASHVAFPVAAKLLAALFIALLALIVFFQVIAARDRRDIKVGILLTLLSLAALAAGDQAFDAASEYGSRLGLAAILALSIVIGGRVIPTVTSAALAEPTETLPKRLSVWIELFAAVGTAIGLAAWILAPALYATALACAAATIGQAARLLQWRFWRVLPIPGVVVLHVGYAWIPTGFALSAAHLLYPELCNTDAVVHAWAVGVIGVMCLGVWASMIRRQTRAPFEFSVLVSAAYVCVFIAAVARVSAACSASMPMTPLWLGAVTWIAAYVLFLMGFARKLLRREASPSSIKLRHSLPPPAMISGPSSAE